MAAANKEVVAALSGTTTIIIILVSRVQTMKSLFVNFITVLY